MTQEYKNPTPTVDLIITKNDNILLVLRKNPPHGWALPGGFVDEGECIEAAALREAKEETGLDLKLSELFYVYSDPNRDPRKHTLSTVFIAETNLEPTAGDDAAQAQFFPLSKLPKLCFDHECIINDYIEYKKTKIRPQLERFNKKQR